PPPWPPAVAWQESEGPPAPPGPAPEYDWAGREARAVGVAVHRLLQVIAADGPDAWPAARLRGTAALLGSMLREEGLAADELAAALERCYGALQRTLDGPRGRWLLDPGHRDCASERAVSGRLGGRQVNGIIDRSFVDAAGALWIVDYKTGHHAGGDLE